MAKKVQIDVKINTASGVKNVGDLNKEVEKSVKTIHTLQDELNDLERYIKDVDVGSDLFKEMADRSKELTAELKDVNLEMKGLTDTDIAQAFASTVSGFASISTGALAMADSLGLVDKKNDEMTKTLVSGIAVANSFSLGMNGIIKAQTLLKNSTIASTIATKAGTVATRIFNAVVNANPIALLVTALIAAVSAFALFSSGSKDAAKDTENLKEVNERLNNTLKRQNELIKRQNELNTKKFELSTNKNILATERQLIKLKQEYLELTEVEVKDLDALEKKQIEIGEAEKKLVIQQAAFKKEQLKKNIEELGKEITDNKTIEEIKEFNKRLFGSEELTAAQIEQLAFNKENNKLILQEQENLAEELSQVDSKTANAKLNIENDTRNKIKALRNGIVDDTVVNNNLILAEIDKLNADEELAKIQHNKNLALLEADKVEDTADRELAIQKVKTEYLNKETEAVQKVSDKQIEVLKARYKNDFDAAKGNTDLQKKLTTEFNNDREKIYRETELEIQRMTNETTQEVADNFKSTIETWLSDNEEMLAIATETGQALTSSFNDFLNEQNELAASRRKELYNQESEDFKAQLANREISQIEYDNKMKILDNKNKQEELAAKRKAFKQEKAMRIVSAIMAGGQAVMSGISMFGPPPSPLGIASMIAAGVTTAAQIAVISSQKFKAARGGIVPGNGPSHIDSVDALLAPGETVINANSSSMFPGLLSEINKAGGGVSLAPDIFNQGVDNDNSVFGETVNNNQSIKAFVVESEITEKQRRISRIERSASFG